LKPPTPTPNTGWWTASLSPFVTSFERPLVTRLRPPLWCRTFGDAIAAITNTATASPTRRSARPRHANAAATSTPTASATKLDCENENNRPIAITEIAAAAATTIRSERVQRATTSEASIATTRKRP
jgi:hypothetical protein